MEKFNQLVGLIFGNMYKDFPEPVALLPELYLQVLPIELSEDEACNFPNYFESTINWLQNHGYIFITQDMSSFDGPAFEGTLSEKGLVALRKIPDSIEGTASLGDRLVDFSKEKASGAVSALISLIINSAGKL